MSVKILHLSSARSFGGGERHLADLILSLATRGHDVSVVLVPHSPLVDKLPDLAPGKIFTLRIRHALDLMAARHISRIIAARKIDIVHAHMARDYPLAALVVGREQRPRLVFTRHVLFPLGRLHRATFARASRVIAVSEAVARSLRAQTLCSPEKIVCIRNGVDLARFTNERGGGTAVDDSARDHSTRFVGMLGEISPIKGQEQFVRAAALLASRFPGAQFLIAGEDESRGGDARRRVEALIDNSGLKNRVRLLGRIENVAQYLSTLDVFVSASRSESFGLAIVEASACGAAVVATGTAGAREVIEDGVSGLIVPIDDAQAMAQAVGALLEDEDRRRSLARHGFLSVSDNFSLQRMTDETERLYRDLLGAS